MNKHVHHRFPSVIYDIAGLGIPMGVRWDTDDEDPDGGAGSGGASGAAGGKPMVSMSQASMDALMRDAKSQARRSEQEAIQKKYGDLDELKAKAENAEGTEAKEALDTLLKSLKVDAEDGAKLKDLVAKATERAQELTKVESDQADAALLKVRQDALTKAKMNPALAGVLALKGTTPEELATELETMKPVVGATGQQGGSGQGTGVGQGTNPTGTGKEAPASLNEAIAAHYQK
jgi:hypothetical protein